MDVYLADTSTARVVDGSLRQVFLASGELRCDKNKMQTRSRWQLGSAGCRHKEMGPLTLTPPRLLRITLRGQDFPSRLADLRDLST